MSTDQNLLTAAPLAFILILPVFFYYCLRTLLVKQDNIATTFAPQSRIPDYLIKQHVDKTRQVRKQYRKPHKKTMLVKPSLRHLTAKTKLLAKPTIQFLGQCSAGLSKFTNLNEYVKNKFSLPERDPRCEKKIQKKTKPHQLFQPTILTTIYEDVEY